MKKIMLTLAILVLLTGLAACNQGKSNQYTDPQGNKYKYKLELTGTMPNAEKETTFIILTNDPDLTFEKVAKSLYSSNMNDWLDIYFVPQE
jgi:ABC-type glycerol-3-phosphate transport system substrate-binding protein